MTEAAELPAEVSEAFTRAGAPPKPDANGAAVPSDVAVALRPPDAAEAGELPIFAAMRASGLRQQLGVELDDGRKLLAESNVQDARRLEVVRKKSFFDDKSLSDLMFLAWAALKRTGQITEKFPEFETRVIELYLPDPDADEAAEPDPTQTDRGDDF